MESSNKKCFDIFNVRKKRQSNTNEVVQPSIERNIEITQSISKDSHNAHDIHISDVGVRSSRISVTVSNNFSGESNNDLSDLGTLETGPIRPILAAYPKTKFGAQNRAFSSNYYKDYNWLEYSIKLDALFCFACRTFTVDSGHTEDTFKTVGFNNWKKLAGSRDQQTKKTRLQSHALTQHHLTAMMKWDCYVSSKKSGISVVSQLSAANQKEILSNREYVKCLIDIVLYHSRQGLALRAHREDVNSTNRGNFKEMCCLFAKHNPDFGKIYNFQKKNYSSWAIQNELIAICASNLKNYIIKEIRECGMFSIQCDEARCHKQEQLAICLRYANDLKVVERFIEFHDVSKNQNANSLVDVLLYFINSSNLNDIPIIGQAYDGASVMSGSVGGVQAKFRQAHPLASQAIYVHCMAHKLNLVVVDMCSHLKDARNLFNGLEALYVHFSHPSKDFKLTEMQQKLGLKINKLTQLSETRWVCRYKSCKALIKNYQAILKSLDEEINE